MTVTGGAVNKKAQSTTPSHRRLSLTAEPLGPAQLLRVVASPLGIRIGLYSVSHSEAEAMFSSSWGGRPHELGTKATRLPPIDGRSTVMDGYV